MIDPGEDGPISPHFVNVKNVIAQMLPTIGAMITIGSSGYMGSKSHEYHRRNE